MISREQSLCVRASGPVVPTSPFLFGKTQQADTNAAADADASNVFTRKDGKGRKLLAWCQYQRETSKTSEKS